MNILLLTKIMTIDETLAVQFSRPLLCFISHFSAIPLFQHPSVLPNHVKRWTKNFENEVKYFEVKTLCAI